MTLVLTADRICIMISWKIFGLRFFYLKQNLFLCVFFYRPPRDNNCIPCFEESISKIRSDCEIIIMGDVNIDFFQKDCVLFKD